MVGPAPFEPYTFRALAKTFGTLWLRCDVCRRYARLLLAGLHDVDYRTKTFSCSRCGAPAYLCVVNPSHGTGRESALSWLLKSEQQSLTGPVVLGLKCRRPTAMADRTRGDHVQSYRRRDRCVRR